MQPGLKKSRHSHRPPGYPPPSWQEIIYLKERNDRMLKKDLILRNPLRLMDQGTNEILSTGDFGAVLARAGVGKTAFLVQLSMNTLLCNKNVLHISLDDPVNKVSLWYEEVFQRISQQYGLKQTDQIWEDLLSHRLIMTFRVEGFSVPKLEERLTDLTQQGIFSPQMMLIDGLPFNITSQRVLHDLKQLADEHGIHIWFTVKTHRHEPPNAKGLPMQLSDIEHLFEAVILLMPENDKIHIKALKGGRSKSHVGELLLDPSTMLINDPNQE
jgi:hypothetical protein